MFADNDFLKCTLAHKVLPIKQSTGRLHAVQTERKSPVNGRVHTNNALCDNVATVAGQCYSELLWLFKEILLVVVFFLIPHIFWQAGVGSSSDMDYFLQAVRSAHLPGR